MTDSTNEGRVCHCFDNDRGCLSQGVLLELGVVPVVPELSSYIVCDNIGNIFQTTELRFHQKTKHIRLMPTHLKNE